MIEFYVKNSKIICKYTQEYGPPENWVLKRFQEGADEITIKSTFHFSKGALFIPESIVLEQNEEQEDDFDADPEPVHFVFAQLSGSYFKVQRGVLVKEFDIYLHKDMDVDVGCFLTDSDISVFNIIATMVNKDVYIGGNHIESIPIQGFQKLLAGFPNPYEKKQYVRARVASVLRNYVDQVKDVEAQYHRYMNKKISKKGTDLTSIFREIEVTKYEAILFKLQEMLNSEEAYSEKQWQEEILQILLFIYPKYIAVFREVPIKARNLSDKFLDYMLADASGYTDIVEIKRPFEKAIITEAKYRNNFIPLRDLSGTIMQIEKYIFYLNRWGYDGEKYLTEKYRNALPEGLSIRIANPSGIIIMGRETNLSDAQKLDFEVVKRKYKNVVDIITYDNLIGRLAFMIEQLKKGNK